MASTTDLLITVRYDPSATVEVSIYTTIADHPIVELATLDPNLAGVGSVIMRLLRAAVEGGFRSGQSDT